MNSKLAPPAELLRQPMNIFRQSILLQASLFTLYKCVDNSSFAIKLIVADI